MKFTYQYSVHIMTNKNRTTLYTGVTNNLAWRVLEHKNHELKGFSNRYNLEIPVYFEISDDIYAAIYREKQIIRRISIEKNRINRIYQS